MKQHPDLVNVPITGVGGIETWRDALEFILVGASTSGNYGSYAVWIPHR